MGLDGRFCSGRSIGRADRGLQLHASVARLAQPEVVEEQVVDVLGRMACEVLGVPAATAGAVALAHRAGAPRHLAAPLNSKGWDFGAKLSPDGRWLFFTSNRGFGSEPLAAPLTFEQLQGRLHAPGNGLRDIYVVDARVLDDVR